jgi:hypothetical protein
MMRGKGGGSPSGLIIVPCLWSKRYKPGKTELSLGSMETASSATIPGGKDRPQAELRAYKLALISAVLVPYPLSLGAGECKSTVPPVGGMGRIWSAFFKAAVVFAASGRDQQPASSRDTSAV